VVGHGHFLEGDLFGVFEERVGSPHELEPTDRQQPVLGSHVVWQPQPIVFPALSKENVSGKRLKKVKRNSISLYQNSIKCLHFHLRHWKLNFLAFQKRFWKIPLSFFKIATKSKVIF